MISTGGRLRWVGDPCRVCDVPCLGLRDRGGFFFVAVAVPPRRSDFGFDAGVEGLRMVTW
jgi:hypothetical protein